VLGGCRPYNPGAAGLAAARSARLFLKVPADDGALGARLWAHLADDRVAGVILRPAAGQLALRELVDYALPELLASGAIRTTGRGALRERLSLPAPGPLPEQARPACPATA
jgi:hypothetical protein